MEPEDRNPQDEELVWSYRTLATALGARQQMNCRNSTLRKPRLIAKYWQFNVLKKKEAQR
jgi:hypothetical protein